MLPIYEYNGSLAGNILEGTDVINTLASSETAKPLSAAQGKLIKDKVNNQYSLTELWSGTYTGYGQTFTLSDDVNNYSFIIFYGVKLNNPEKYTYTALIPWNSNFTDASAAVNDMYYNNDIIITRASSNQITVDASSWLNESSNSGINITHIYGIKKAVIS